MVSVDARSTGDERKRNLEFIEIFSGVPRVPEHRAIFLSARACPETGRRTLPGPSRTEENGGGGASIHRESSGASEGVEGASGSWQALARVTTEARLVPAETRNTGE